jgi:nucleotide-binding universal stress UspA family protein
MDRPIARILVHADLSPASLEAVDYAIAIARQFGSALHLLQVVDPVVSANGADVYIGVPTIRNLLIDEAAQNVSALLKRAKRRGIPARGEVRLGRVPIVIREVADTERCDLVVLGPDRRTGIVRERELARTA